MKKRSAQRTKHIENGIIELPNWIRVTGRFPGKGFHVAAHLIHWVRFMRKRTGEPFRYSILQMARDFGISRKAAAKGLQWLVKAGFITIREDRGLPSLIVLERMPEEWGLPNPEQRDKNSPPLFENQPPLDKEKTRTALAPRNWIGRRQ